MCIRLYSMFSCSVAILDFKMEKGIQIKCFQILKIQSFLDNICFRIPFQTNQNVVVLHKVGSQIYTKHVASSMDT